MVEIWEDETSSSSALIPKVSALDFTHEESDGSLMKIWVVLGIVNKDPLKSLKGSFR